MDVSNVVCGVCNNLCVDVFGKWVVILWECCSNEVYVFGGINFWYGDFNQMFSCFVLVVCCDQLVKLGQVILVLLVNNGINLLFVDQLLGIFLLVNDFLQ